MIFFAGLFVGVLLGGGFVLFMWAAMERHPKRPGYVDVSDLCRARPRNSGSTQ